MLSHLITFVVLGVVQIVMAVWGGIVSVKSLPEGQNKALHQWVFLLLGIIGIFLIVSMGHQTYQAEGDDLKFRSDAKATQKTIQYKLEQSNAAQNTMNGELLTYAALLGQIKDSGSAGVKELAAALQQLLQKNAQSPPKQEPVPSDTTRMSPAQSVPSASSVAPVAAQTQALKSLASRLTTEINNWADLRLKDVPVKDVLEPLPSPRTTEEQKKVQEFHELIESEWRDRFALMANAMLGQLQILKVAPTNIHACYSNINLGSGDRGLLNTHKMCAGFIEQAAEKLN